MLRRAVLALSASALLCPCVHGAVPVRVQKGLLFLEASVGGRPLQWIVDTGAEESVLSRRAAEKLGMPMVAHETILGVGGEITASRAAPESVRVGGETVLTKRLLVMDLEGEARSLGCAVDGLLGMDVLRGRSVRIDLGAKRLDFSAGTSPRTGALVLPLARNRHAICVEARVDGVTLPMVRVDTGCVRSLCWSPPRGERRPWRSVVEREVVVVLGTREWKFDDSQVFREPRFPGEDGLLGMGALARFQTVWIDMQRGRLVLEGG